MIMDEGTPITRTLLPRLKRPIAMISAAEKGYLSVLLTLHNPHGGGHSSFPTRDGTLINRVTKLIDLLHHNPMPLRHGDSPMFKSIAREYARQ